MKSLNSYQIKAFTTDRTGPEVLIPVLGLFGEIGSVVAVLKKMRRDGKAFPRYDAALKEELGDALWYLSSLCSKLDIQVEGLLLEESKRPDGKALEVGLHDAKRLENQMKKLAVSGGELVSLLNNGASGSGSFRNALAKILNLLFSTAETVDLDLYDCAEANLEKVFSRFAQEKDRRYPPLADEGMPIHEQLPRAFSLRVEEHETAGGTYVLLQRNGVNIGDRLTDNKKEKDDYRFHDVFHVAYAVHLGWSPVLRSLFKVKRKSQPSLDRDEDGARAALLEEGIATMIFNQALESNPRLFAGLDHLSYDLLKLVHGLTKGFEPHDCALWQWESAILDGFRLFRDLQEHRRGIIKADLVSRTVEFIAINEPLNAPFAPPAAL